MELAEAVPVELFNVCKLFETLPLRFYNDVCKIIKGNIRVFFLLLLVYESMENVIFNFDNWSQSRPHFYLWYFAVLLLAVI